MGRKIIKTRSWNPLERFCYFWVELVFLEPPQYANDQESGKREGKGERTKLGKENQGKKRKCRWPFIIQMSKSWDFRNKCIGSICRSAKFHEPSSGGLWIIIYQDLHIHQSNQHCSTFLYCLQFNLEHKKKGTKEKLESHIPIKLTEIIK